MQCPIKIETVGKIYEYFDDNDYEQQSRCNFAVYNKNEGLDRYLDKESYIFQVDNDSYPLLATWDDKMELMKDQINIQKVEQDNQLFNRIQRGYFYKS